MSDERERDAMPADDAAAEEDTGAPTASEMVVGFTSKQLFTGFAIIAGLILMARRRSRRGRRSPHGGDGKEGS